MFSKILKYCILSIAIFLWLQAYSPLIYKSTGLFPDDYRFGDLYRLSYLSDFKEKASKCPTIKSEYSEQNVNLFIIGDSFTEAERVNINDFNVGNYTYTHWAKQADIQLDTNKRNILILETVERTAKDHFSQKAENFKIENKNSQEVKNQQSWKQKLKENVTDLVKFIFPKGIEERLEHTLFNYDFFLHFREVKAQLNHHIFGRVEHKVVLSKDEKHIFYSEEADSTNEHSAFYPVSQEEIDKFVLNINETREAYLKAGFDEVYLSVIPNKVSILSPELGKYNHLIERIETDKRLQIPIIDTYKDFKKSPDKIYLKSDTHWSCAGRDIWLEKVNKIIKKKPTE
ncbi:hypothetical protein LV89_02862 [Arcicella aurantiaca]|uniref:Uncharacterized protein n=1 Tax=Arcicella aurantiaca TaxID=591202 RepID=A0A316E578_9BACT|nr:hypothetical protein [Arcicella aurantiaca]PWK25236.1 hypothetical protein LV89_02862 [Arcicella aurantiaca]